jgi:hypothetical protein
VGGGELEDPETALGGLEVILARPQDRDERETAAVGEAEVAQVVLEDQPPEGVLPRPGDDGPDADLVAEDPALVEQLFRKADGPPSDRWYVLSARLHGVTRKGWSRRNGYAMKP